VRIIGPSSSETVDSTLDAIVAGVQKASGAAE
jgi:hypothetical protein